MRYDRDAARAALPSLRPPRAEDGAAIWDLVARCKPLDENSMYCNLIQCDHFAQTCVLAEVKGRVQGWVSAYVMPNDPETLFVWQVAVAEEARGLGLGTLMLQSILGRTAAEGVTRLQTTITIDNPSSWALFRKFARIQGGAMEAQPYFMQTLHFRDRHKTENLVTIRLPQRVARAA